MYVNLMRDPLGVHFFVVSNIYLAYVCAPDEGPLEVHFMVVIDIYLAYVCEPDEGPLEFISWL